MKICSEVKCFLLLTDYVDYHEGARNLCNADRLGSPVTTGLPFLY